MSTPFEMLVRDLDAFQQQERLFERRPGLMVSGPDRTRRS